MKINKKFKYAFTLAEVLIVLGIIGVVAEMTIPVLMSNVQEQQYIAGVKKAYSVLSQAYTMATTEYGSPETWTTGTVGTGAGADDFATKMTNYMKVVLDCGATSGLGCFAKGVTYKYITGGAWTVLDNEGTSSKVKLIDGTSLRFYLNDNSCSGVQGTTSSLSTTCASVIVDVNGSKNPNTLGKDTFYFWITKYGVVPFGTTSDTTYTFSSYCITDGHACAAWVLYNNNEDYVKSCKTTLDWTKSLSCN